MHIQRRTRVDAFPRRPLWFSTVLASALLAAASGLRAQTSAARFEVTNYSVAAELFPSTHLLKANVRIDFVPEANLSSLSFELHGALRVERVLDASRQEARFRQDGTTLGVDFANPLPRGKPSSITVTYGGALASAEGSPVENLKLAYVGPEGSSLLYAGRWFPVNVGGLDRFSATMRISVPSDEIVIASGKASTPLREAGKVTYTFEYDRKSFPGTVLASRYVIQPGTSGADLTLYLKPGHESFAASYGETAAKILGFYSEKFGPLPDAHLALAEIDDGSVGGYTTPGVVAIAARGFSNPVNYRLLAHEISHLWWRCLVSPATPNDALLDEGLATYSAALDVQEMAGDAAFEDVMHEIEIGALTHEEVAPISQAGRLHEFTPEYQSIVYDKGGMVFHMLRWVIGDDAFFKTLQAMARQDAWKSIFTDEFQKLTEQVSKQELTYFFALWVSSSGVPQFKSSWAIYRTANGYQVGGKIQQDLDIFRMPVEVRVSTEGRRPTSERVEVVGTTGDFTINTKTKPTRVVIDPGSRLLKYDQKTRFEVEMARGDQLVQEQAYLEAAAQYQKVLKLNANSSLAHYRLGEIYFKLHNYNSGASEMREALNGDLDPKWVEVWTHLTLGKIYDVTGQRDRALNEYQRALQTRNNAQGALEEANRYIQKPYREASSQGK